MVREVNKLEALAQQILSISREKRTGTLRVGSTESQTKQVVFIQGYVADVDTGREDTALEAALLNTGEYSEKDLKRARKACAKKEVSLGAALLELDLVTEEVIVECVQQQVLEEVCMVFDWEVQLLGDIREHGFHDRVKAYSHAGSRHRSISWVMVYPS